MSTMGMSQGQTDQPTDMKDASEQSTGTVSKSASAEILSDLPKDTADFERPEHLDCDSIFAQAAGERDEEDIKTISSSQPVTYVTQSKFFTPLFNAAIFDGPIRIYFAQHQESQAMKLYFNLQERYSDLRKQARDVFRERGANIFVMLYPDTPTFEKSFAVDFDDVRADQIAVAIGSGSGAEAGAKRLAPSACAQTAVGRAPMQTIASDRMGSDYVLGVRGPIEDETFESLCQKMETIIRVA